MTDYVAIMNRIHEMIYNSTNDKCVLEYIAQELQNEGIGWIPVSERLPKTSGMYHVIHICGNAPPIPYVTLAQYSMIVGWHCDDPPVSWHLPPSAPKEST